MSCNSSLAAKQALHDGKGLEINDDQNDALLPFQSRVNACNLCSMPATSADGTQKAEEAHLDALLGGSAQPVAVGGECQCMDDITGIQAV